MNALLPTQDNSPKITLRDAPGSSMCIVIAGRPFHRRKRSDNVTEFVCSDSGELLGYWLASPSKSN